MTLQLFIVSLVFNLMLLTITIMLIVLVNSLLEELVILKNQLQYCEKYVDEQDTSLSVSRILPSPEIPEDENVQS
jgi:hypothetical protein